MCQSTGPPGSASVVMMSGAQSISASMTLIYMLLLLLRSACAPMMRGLACPTPSRSLPTVLCKSASATLATTSFYSSTSAPVHGLKLSMSARMTRSSSTGPPLLIMIITAIYRRPLPPERHVAVSRHTSRLYDNDPKLCSVIYAAVRRVVPRSRTKER
jgi:hypothetical protein